MEKKEILENLEYALKGVLCNGLEGIDLVAMNSNIELFMCNEVSDLSSQEIIEKFYTPEKTIKIFMDFLAETGAMEDSGDNTLQ